MRTGLRKMINTTSSILRAAFVTQVNLNLPYDLSGEFIEEQIRYSLGPCGGSLANY